MEAATPSKAIAHVCELPVEMSETLALSPDT